MRLDAGVPDRHCGVASRAISSAMVDHQSILLVHLECITLGILQVVVGLDYSRTSWGIDCKCNPSLLLRVGLSSNNIIAIEMF